MNQTSNAFDTYFNGMPNALKETKLWHFSVGLQMATWPFPDDFKDELGRVFYQSLFKRVSASHMRIGNLRYNSFEQSRDIQSLLARAGTNERTGWFTIAYSEPGYEFGITIDDSTVQISCKQIRLEQLVKLSKDVFTGIINDVILSEEFSKLFLLQERTHTIQYLFHHRVRLGVDKIQGQQVENHKIMSAALSLDHDLPAKGERRTQDALRSLGTEKYVRLDFAQHALKKLRGQDYNLIINVEAPYNEQNSTLDVTAAMNMEEEFGLDLKVGLDLEVALIDFYRDIIFRRFLDNLLCTTNYNFL